jgi:hypothetical protein
MRVSLLLIIVTFLSVVLSKPRFKYVQVSVPLQISVSGLGTDKDDAVSKLLRDSLSKAGFILISSEQRKQLLLKYLEEVKENYTNLNSSDDPKSSSYFNKVFSRGTASQVLTVIYTNLQGENTILENCDSVGFHYSKMPPASLNQRPIRLMWHISEIHNKNPDSVFLYLSKKI